MFSEEKGDLFMLTRREVPLILKEKIKMYATFRKTLEEVNLWFGELFVYY